MSPDNATALIPDAATLRLHRELTATGPWIGSRGKLRPTDAARFVGAGLPSAFARALAHRGATSPKELLEATEVFALARKRVRRPVIADLCSGHGLAGVLFALMERRVEQVVLVDRQRPSSADAILEAAAEVAPWVAPKITWRVERLANTRLAPGTGVVAIHACGMRTDTAMNLAIASEGPFVALPCCRPHRLHPAPEGLKAALGADTAIDVHRTYALEQSGYHVSWRSIHAAITPMNRVLLAWPRAPKSP